MISTTIGRIVGFFLVLLLLLREEEDFVPERERDRVVRGAVTMAVVVVDVDVASDFCFERFLEGGFVVMVGPSLSLLDDDDLFTPFFAAFVSFLTTAAAVAVVVSFLTTGFFFAASFLTTGFDAAATFSFLIAAPPVFFVASTFAVPFPSALSLADAALRDDERRLAAGFFFSSSSSAAGLSTCSSSLTFAFALRLLPLLPFVFFGFVVASSLSSLS